MFAISDSCSFGWGGALCMGSCIMCFVASAVGHLVTPRAQEFAARTLKRTKEVAMHTMKRTKDLTIKTLKRTKQGGAAATAALARTLNRAKGPPRNIIRLPIRRPTDADGHPTHQPTTAATATTTDSQPDGGAVGAAPGAGGGGAAREPQSDEKAIKRARRPGSKVGFFAPNERFNNGDAAKVPDSTAADSNDANDVEQANMPQGGVGGGEYATSSAKEEITTQDTSGGGGEYAISTAKETFTAPSSRVSGNDGNDAARASIVDKTHGSQTTGSAVDDVDDDHKYEQPYQLMSQVGSSDLGDTAEDADTDEHPYHLASSKSLHHVGTSYIEDIDTDAVDDTYQLASQTCEDV